MRPVVDGTVFWVPPKGIFAGFKFSKLKQERPAICAEARRIAGYGTFGSRRFLDVLGGLIVRFRIRLR